MKRTNIYLTLNQLELLKNISFKTGLSMGELVRRAIDNFLNSKGDKPLRWPTNSEKHAYMKKRQQQNRSRTLENVNENWLADILAKTDYKWTRQAIWGYRIFDFWCHELGIAIESDGPEHNKEYDAYRDKYNFQRSGIIVIRVKNKNEEDAKKALEIISKSETWLKRRENLGLLTKAQIKKLKSISI